MLGDMIHTALSSVGVTPERVSSWLGKPCACPEYRTRLNQLTWWARRVILGKASLPPEGLTDEPNRS